MFNCTQKQRICYWICENESIKVSISPEIHQKMNMAKVASVGFRNIGQLYQISIYSFFFFLNAFHFCVGLMEGIKHEWIKFSDKLHCGCIPLDWGIKSDFVFLCIKNSWRWLQLWNEQREAIPLLQLWCCLLRGWDRLPDRWPQGEGVSREIILCVWVKETFTGS